MYAEGRLFGGRYRAERQLGAGGYGVVLRAVDDNTGRPVALKLLRSSDLDEEARLRFEREARVVQQLSHPNTVRLFDFGTDPDGTPYIVYELLDGETLSQIMRRGPVPLDRTLRIATQLLKALSEAHQLGIVHRDIKPANVMVVQFSGDRDVVKLLDFGIAKPLMAATKALTNTGVVLGTPRFMSPEQVNGGAILPRSDIYSVGLLMLEMLTGSRVFAGAPMDVLKAHVTPELVPIPPGVLALSIGSVLARALEKDPNKRFADAAEMLAALEQCVARQPVAPTLVDTTYDASAVSPHPTASARTGRGPMLWVAFAGGLLAAVVGIVMVVVSYQRAQTAEATPTARSLASQPPPVVVGAVPSGEPASGVKLEVTTVPEGAVLFMDGARACDRTPCELLVAPDAMITLEANKGALSGKVVVQTEHGQTVTIQLSASPTPAAKPAQVWCYREVLKDGLNQVEKFRCPE